MFNEQASRHTATQGSSCQVVSEYDIIIVGAGSAGTLLANRLVTSPKLQGLSILILESGLHRPDDRNINIPGYQRYLLGNPEYDWCFTSEKEPDLNGRRIKQPRGRVVGGTSAINSHSLVFPSRFYHDYWDEKLLNNANSSTDLNIRDVQPDVPLNGFQKTHEAPHSQVDWSWTGVAGCYSRAFDVQPPDMKLCEDLNLRYSASADGKTNINYELTSVSAPEYQQARIKASFPSTVHDLQKTWIKTFENAEFLSSSLGIDGEAFGGLTVLNAVDARPKVGGRSHAAREFWDTIRDRSSVTLRPNVLVNKIEFSSTKSDIDGKLKASGIQLLSDDKLETIKIKSSGEIILCAGAFGSPQILELSGIGAAANLANAGIQCAYELPGVGENLQDHLNCGCSVELKDNIKSRDIEDHDQALWKSYSAQYDLDRTGQLANGGAYSYAYVPTQWLSTESEQNDLEKAMNSPSDQAGNTAISKGIQLQHQFIKAVTQHPGEATGTMLAVPRQRHPDLDTLPASEPKIVPGNYATFITMLSYPFSRGSCHIVSSDPQIRPELKFNYLSHPLDRVLFRSHMKQIDRLLQLPPLSSIIKPDGRRLPRSFPHKFTDASDTELDEMLKKTVATNYHPCGTCAMMREDLGGVVDETFKVYGTANVRVVDASVIPIIPRGNILTTVYAVAEKAAGVLSDYYSSQVS